MSLIETILKRDEGEKLYVYKDSLGILTCGIGHRVWSTDNLKLGEQITQEKCDQFFRNDLEDVQHDLLEALPWLPALDEPRLAVLFSMAFNLGVEGLLNFRHTLKAVQAHDWQDAAEAMMHNKWAGQVGDRAKRLSHIMLTGDASEYGA